MRLILIIIVLIIAAVLLAVIFGKDGEEEEKKVEVTDKEETVLLTAEEIKLNEEKLGGSIESGELSKCDKLQGEFKKVCHYNILMNQAVNNLDQSICSQIDDENYKNSCIDLVKQNKAAGVKPITKEEEIKESVLSGTAYQNLSSAYEDNNLTDPVFNEFIKTVAYVNQPNLCWELTQELRQECLERVYILQAKKEDNTEICDNIPTPAWKDECYAQALTRRAVEQNNSEICNQITQINDKNKCKNEF